MAKPAKDEDKQHLGEQVEKYTALFPRYKQYGEALEKVLRAVTKKYASEAIVRVRAKSISSFAEKIQRKKTEHHDPVNEFTDLCGARVIATTPSEVQAICHFIELHFDIDWGNSIDVSQRHRPTEFGYRSVHYIVSFKEGVFPDKDVNVSIPKSVFPDNTCPMKAEIQVRTLLEHAWAVFTHERTYKSAFKIPEKWERELAVVAAVLEDADKDFDRIQKGLKTYATHYGAYMNQDQINEEIEKLELVLVHDPDNAGLAVRIGQLAISVDDWTRAIDVLSPFAARKHQEALKLLGFAMTKKHRKTPKGKNFRQGQKYLEEAIALDKDDADAAATLAGTWKGIDDDTAGELYRQAYEIDPTDPYPLENYLSYEMIRKKDTSIVSMVSPVLNASIQRCRQQVEVGVNIPWAFYSMGKFYLLLKKPYESLGAYARAIQLSTGHFMIDTALASLDKLSPVEKDLPGFEWIRRLLITGRAARFPKESGMKEVKKLAAKSRKEIQGPVVIVAGGCDASVERKIQSYRDMLVEAFKDFNGTIISGGTTQGICGLVGGLREKYSDTIHTIGYIPKMVPANATVDKDPLRYKEIRYTDGTDFSPIEPIQNWIDILNSGIDPKDVKVLGINGGQISSAEYRIALAMGAKVALIEKSGREATKLLNDPFWKNSEGLLCVPEDEKTLQAFVHAGTFQLSASKRTAIAKSFHDVYQESTKEEWGALREEFKESNLQAADHIMEKLRKIQCEAIPVKERNIKILKLTDKEIEIMAEMEHGRWNVERLMDGWKWGEEKDVSKKINPTLVSWKDLPPEEKKQDENMVRKIPEILANVGLEIKRKSKGKK